MSVWRKFERNFEPVVIVAMLAMVITMVFINVFMRFAFKSSISEANEIAQFAFVYMIYFGIAYAIREKRHLRVTLVVNALPAKLRFMTGLFAEFVFLAYSVAVTWYGIVITEQALSRGKILPATEWPTAALYVVIFISGALCAARLIESIVTIIRTGELPFPESEEPEIETGAAS